MPKKAVADKIIFDYFEDIGQTTLTKLLERKTDGDVEASHAVAGEVAVRIPVIARCFVLILHKIPRIAGAKLHVLCNFCAFCCCLQCSCEQ